MSRVSDVLVQIDTAASEQATGVAQVGEAVQQMDALTQQNAAMVEELAASAAALNGQVSRVRDSIRVFRLSDQDRSLAEADAADLRKAQRGDTAPGATPGADNR